MWNPKIKLFGSGNYESLEKSINEFLSKPNVRLIDIKYCGFWAPTSMSGSTITELNMFDRIMVLYEDRNNDPDI